MANQMISERENPRMRYSGEANFGKNYYCIWETKDGSTSVCIIQNKSNDNTLTVVISGAPDTIITTDGVKFNGQHQLPPNNPTHNITAVGNFTGTQVTIFNMSPLNAICGVNCKVAQ